ncbi:hypothetical protein ACG02S_10805 [Roseateles sp. DC23W]|uniref:Uncharacterized protein n=1 Tax=Pelomonas dachongensis TaxID=3299029 RepID=A0ABW7ENC4_9BURK
MKSPGALAALLAISLTASAVELTAADGGTFAVLDRQQAPTQIYYPLSLKDGKWLMEGKQAGAPWTDLSCETGCEYRASTDAEVQAHVPSAWRERADFTCIRNVAQAFCRYSAKGNTAAAPNYVVIALVTGQPVPLFVRRTVSAP